MLSEAKHLGPFEGASVQKRSEILRFAQNDIYKTAKSIHPARCFEQEPRSSLGFIDPNFD
jgi:hypothetical protein